MSRFNREAHLKEFLPHVNIIDSSQVYGCDGSDWLLSQRFDSSNLSKVMIRYGFHSKPGAYNLRYPDPDQKRINQKLRRSAKH